MIVGFHHHLEELRIFRYHSRAEQENGIHYLAFEEHEEEDKLLRQHHFRLYVNIKCTIKNPCLIVLCSIILVLKYSHVGSIMGKYVF